MTSCDVVLCHPVRTAIGTYGGSLKDLPAPDLGAVAIRETVRRAGLPVEVPALTVNRVCGSGAQAIVSVAQEIWAGMSECGIAGGMEKMDRAPYLLSQGRWALRSQQRFAAAQAAGHFEAEIATVEVPGRKGSTPFRKDEHNRLDTSAESLARLVSYGLGAVEPGWFGLGPIPAVCEALARAGWSSAQVERVEINEAFAAITLACLRELGFSEEVVNVDGGAIAHGHPIGATGAVLTTRLLHAMQRDGLRRGLVTLCIGGGQGIALALERL